VTLNRASSEDRRRWKRYLLNASIRLVTDTAVIDGRGIRVSEGGISLFAAANLAVGTQIKLEFMTPPSKKLLSVRGAVRYRAVYLYGVEFLAEDFKDQQQIAHLGNLCRTKHVHF